MEQEIDIFASNQCRVCTKYIIATKEIDLFEKNNENLLHQLKDLTGIMLNKTSYLPRFICIECRTDLENAYAFRQRFFEAENFFLSTKKEILEDPIGSKEDQTCNSDTNHFTDDKIVEIKSKCIFKDSKFNGNLEKDDIEKIELSFNEERISKNQDNKVQLNTNRTLKQLSSSKKRIKGLSKHKRLICDQCGSGFSTKQNFDLHWRRHYNQRPYECELCPEKYFVAADLKRHMRLHTGEKPYLCRYCDRRFVDSSSRIRHERCSHTNVRPFQCTLCEKAFTNSYILKNHMLTHTKERSFECELCNKMFLRKSHLVTHYRSTTHKDNIKKSSPI